MFSPARYRVDHLSIDVLKAVDTADAANFGVPVSVYGIGNCVFRTIALLMSGDEEKWHEYRVRTALELERNCQEYAKRMVSHATVSLYCIQHVNFIPQLLSARACINFMLHAPRIICNSKMHSGQLFVMSRQRSV